MGYFQINVDMSSWGDLFGSGPAVNNLVYKYLLCHIKVKAAG